MTPGPTIIRECSVCGKLIAQHTIGSGNTFGARFWTDGKRDAPMLPDQPWMVKCPHCGALVWIDEQKQVGTIEPFRKDRETSRLKDALAYTVPSHRDYRAYLAQGVSDKDKERYLRLRAWWAGNDSRRAAADATPMSEDEIANLRIFSVLLDETDEHDRMMKAEVMRELGMFAEARDLLAGPFSKELAQAAAIIQGLAQQDVASVKEMKFN